MIKQHLKLSFLLLHLLLMVFVSNSAFSQNVLSAGGNSAKVSTVELSWTIGEPCIETQNSTSIILTQGFQQSKIIVTEVDQIPQSKVEIAVFPNPANESISIKFGKFEKKNYSYQLFDYTGKLILKNSIDKPFLTISIRDFPTATYLLKVFDNTNELKTFKINKN